MITPNKYCQLKDFSLTLSPESMNEYKTDINTLCNKLLSDKTFHSPKFKMIIEEKLVPSNGRFLARESYKQFCAILLYIIKKIKYNFNVDFSQTSYACLRSSSDYILLNSALGTQEEFPAEHRQNIYSPQFCFLRPLEVLLARKNQNSKLDLPSPRKLQVFGGHYRLESQVPSRKPFWFAPFSKNCLVATTYRQKRQHGEKCFKEGTESTSLTNLPSVNRNKI